jgi:hypothetical protein
MKENIEEQGMDKQSISHLARTVLVAFLLTFMSARITVFLIATRTIPDLYLYVGGTHIHHLNYGIFLLAGIGCYLLFGRPTGRKLKIAAGIYGIGMALTFDEFGMCIHLGGSYWQRASWDAVTVLAAGFGLITFAPSLKRFRPHHWFTAIILVLVVIVFFALLAKSFKYVGTKLHPRIQKIESTAPNG